MLKKALKKGKKRSGTTYVSKRFRYDKNYKKIIQLS